MEGPSKHSGTRGRRATTWLDYVLLAWAALAIVSGVVRLDVLPIVAGVALSIFPLIRLAWRRGWFRPPGDT